MYFSHSQFFDVKDLKILYDGVWAPPPPDGVYTIDHYEFGEEYELDDVDGHTIMLLDLIEGICNSIPTFDQNTSLRIAWLDRGTRCDIVTDILSDVE